ncbi:hypothetical protein I4F81_000407 [Pyropia yezoensis]|uniref:Uncharacterized protein n=1 Tax=Pyropia yezoensis TaxID=2788 RepID=A0ACC3BIN0_PYRYE|nr:hypothetical protein I4F81_000407 [Neopyropia yezoensis]
MGARAVSTAMRPDGIAVVTFANPPVNALGTAVQRALGEELARLAATPAVRGVVLYGDAAGGFFSGGADIAEFASIGSGGAADPFADPATTAVYGLAESGRLPVVAAVGGVCFGGGLELALACAARVATPAASFGLPELKLGIIPGLGGTQRLPRLIGFEPALQAMLRSTVLPAAKAASAGLVDVLLPSGGSSLGALVDAAAGVALEMASGRRRRMVPLEETSRLGSLANCQAVAAKLRATDVARLSKGGVLPQYEAVVAVALEGVASGGQAGLAAEARAFAKLVASPTSKALVHFFFASRGASKLPPGMAGVTARAPRRTAVIGGGLMGAGIATALLESGATVVIKEINAGAAAAARTRVAKNLGSRGAAALSRLSVTTDYEAATFGNLDIVIEAALENVKLKQAIFVELERVTPASCVLATNTSTLNLDIIGAAVPAAHAAGRVVGAHFFAPAHRMPLLEVVRADATSPAVLAAVLALGKKMRKTAVVVGNCPGFAVNRMFFPQGNVAHFLASECGVDPYELDAACEAFGLPMGPFRLQDFVGLDITVAVGGTFGAAFADRAYRANFVPAMIAAGKLGRKSGSGFYTYPSSSPRAPGTPDKSVIAKFIEPVETGAPPLYPRGRALLSPADMVDLTLLPCVNEACRLLEEGVASSPADLDVSSVLGMAFPAHRGGLLYWASTAHGGPAGILARLRTLDDLTGHRCALLKPSFALLRAAAAGSSSLGRPPRPTRTPGAPDDIVIVAAARTAVGRAGRGGFRNTSADNLLAPVLADLLRRTHLSPSDVGDVVMGTVLPRGDSGAVQTRVAAILAGLPETVPVRTANRLCSSGLQAIADAAAAVARGDHAIAIAGGYESMSENAFTNKSLTPNPKVRGNPTAASCYVSMGQTSENVASRFGVGRVEQDVVAVVSHARAAAAMLSGRQAGEIVPVTTRVKPLLVKVAGVDPSVMGIGPAVAIPAVLEKAGVPLSAVDLIELNEAFGSQAHYVSQQLGLNADIVNVNGGAIAIGHPLGMTGARQTVSLLAELGRRGGRYGLVSMCIGTGMGAAALYEVNSDAPMAGAGGRGVVNGKL